MVGERFRPTEILPAKAPTYRAYIRAKEPRAASLHHRHQAATPPAALHSPVNSPVFSPSSAAAIKPTALATFFPIKLTRTTFQSAMGSIPRVFLRLLLKKNHQRLKVMLSMCLATFTPPSPAMGKSSGSP
uniref:Uncharacterized protein n=1 Tax=Arundo donax TaxID=35708 RepID=A0A0A9HQT1_ARUDO